MRNWVEGFRWGGKKTFIRFCTTYCTNKISSKETALEQYIGTDNMLPNMQGITISQYSPTESSITEFKNRDILLANIHPYFKKL